MPTKIDQHLLQLINKINSSLDIDTVLNCAMMTAEEALQAEASAIFEVDVDHGDLFFRLARGEKADKVKSLRLKLGEGVAGWVAQTGQAVIVPRTEADPRFNPGCDEHSGFQTRSILCVPLKHQDRLLGVIQVLNKRPPLEFDQEDLELLTLLAQPIAVALANAQAYTRLAQVSRQVIKTLSKTVELRDPYTAGHQRRVALLAVTIAQEMGLDQDRRESLRVACTLHDIGKIVVPAEILSKPGRINPLEQELVKSHSRVGYEILKEIDFPGEIADFVLQHHERLDGSGYPAGLQGEEISLEARIIAVADVVEAMIFHRPYRPSLGVESALEEISQERGKGLDAKVVDACCRLFQRGFDFE
ncbi:MAG: HD domain-containing protein [Syntrophobacterales bacterium]|jgi:putative nucleotidyltransferase with HDIG domain